MRGIKAYQSQVIEFWGSRLIAPRVPAHVIPKLRGDGYLLQTEGVDIDPGEAYFPAPFDRYLDVDRPDYYVSGGRDNGYSSFWGFLLQAGGMFCAVQDTIGAVVHPGEFANDHRRYDAIFERYNTHLAHVADRGTRPLSVAVLLSTFRKTAMVLSTDSSQWRTNRASGFGFESLSSNWGVVVDLIGTGDSEDPHVVAPDLAHDAYYDSPVIKAAVTFLVSCLEPTEH